MVTTTPEERASAIKLWSKWTSEGGDERTWDDVRQDIANAIREAERAAFQRGAQAMREAIAAEQKDETRQWGRGIVVSRRAADVPLPEYRS